MIVSKCFRYVIALVFTFNTVAFAQSPDVLGMSETKQPQQVSEYIFRSSPKESLISVQLLGAVNKPGIYYVPPSTDLLKLITLAGGSNNGGDMSEITVRKLEPKSWAEIKSKAVSEYQGAYEVDAEKVIKYGGAKQLKLAQDDFIYVPQKSYMVSGDATRTITVVSLVLGIALTALLINKNSGHNGVHFQ
ncbi:SLBB domain-containing protein [Bdellovibrio sp. SKB1291214]|uniref:SLBB domain-containing protein n=1 Tax=Bdellovibrio sp. SKB1291214 TaxID=1732569 RepID=UPI000B51A7DD|nr:SLBB domain-containing protein [Bdellovibrio sp. SKB1291214]UYL10022.1 SLBB domain-containing protein [Bdellovibrio sp. SKB1291214]